MHYSVHYEEVIMFTDKFIQNLKPRAKPYREWEGGSDKGFGVQVTPKGVKTFFQFYRFENKRYFLNLGSYVTKTSLKDARAAARVAKTLLEQGINPQTARQEEITKRHIEEELAKRKQLEEQMKGSVKQLFDYYIKQMQADRKRSWSEVERAFAKNVLPVLGEDMKAKEVKPQHVRLILHNIINRGSMIQANRVRSYLSAAFAYGIHHDFDPKNLKHEVMFGLEVNPVRDVPKPQKQEKPGERDLNADEIKQFWNTFTEKRFSILTEIALKLILATGGQRVQEVLWAKWDEFDLQNKLWEIPSSRTKNGRVHLIPLNDFSVNLLERLQKQKGSSVYLFPKIPSYQEILDAEENPCMPVATLSRAIHRFCFSKDDKGKLIEVFKKFTPRDLRRTCKTRMGELGISKEIRDRVHNHALDDVSSKHYDRYDYLAEKREALGKWNGYLRKIIFD